MIRPSPTGYRLTLKAGRSWHDAAILRPDVLGTLPIDDVRRRLGDAFDIEGSPGPRLTLRNLPPMDGLGAHMTDGELIVLGDAGDHAGLRMRRGWLVVTGSVGASPGYRMRAGTVVIGQGDLDHPGLEMQRGTIVLLDPRATPHTHGTFQPDNVFEAPSMAILGLTLNHLATMGLDIPPAMRLGRWRLSSGDRFELGKGELWQWMG